MTGKRMAAAFLTGILVAQSPGTMLADLLPALALEILGAVVIPMACLLAYRKKAIGGSAANLVDDTQERPTVRISGRAAPIAAAQIGGTDTKSIYTLSNIRRR